MPSGVDIDLEVDGIPATVSFDSMPDDAALAEAVKQVRANKDFQLKLNARQVAPNQTSKGGVAFGTQNQSGYAPVNPFGSGNLFQVNPIQTPAPQPVAPQ